MVYVACEEFTDSVEPRINAAVSVKICDAVDEPATSMVRGALMVPLATVLSAEPPALLNRHISAPGPLIVPLFDHEEPG
jgi:hypothetical protein